MWVFADIKDGPHLRKASASAAEQSRRAGMKHTLIITQTSSSRSTYTQVCFSQKHFFPPAFCSERFSMTGIFKGSVVGKPRK